MKNFHPSETIREIEIFEKKIKTTDILFFKGIPLIADIQQIFG